MPYMSAVDTRLGQEAGRAIKLPVGKGWLRPVDILSARVTDASGSPLKDVQVQLLDPASGSIIQQLPTDTDGIVTFPFDTKYDTNVIVRAIAPAGYHMKPAQYPKKEGLRVLPVPVLAADEKRPQWNFGEHTFPFVQMAGAGEATGFSLFNPWVIGTVIIGGLILYAQFRRS